MRQSGGAGHRARPGGTLALALCGMLLCAGTVKATQTIPLAPQALQRGVVLVADRQLVDANFSQTVVLLIEHGAAGAMGIILNRPTALEVREVIPALREAPSTGAALLYAGGPLAIDAVHVLVAATHRPAGTRGLAPHLYVVDDLLRFSRLDRADIPRVRHYAGYAGWGAEQLETEVGRGDWHLTRIAADAIMDDDASTLWERLIADVSAIWAGRDGDTARRPQRSILALRARPDTVCEGRHESFTGVDCR